MAASPICLAIIVQRVLWQGVVAKLGFPLEGVAAQVCREAEARVSTNIPVRDMDLAAHNNLD